MELISGSKVVILQHYNTVVIVGMVTK